MFGITLAEAEVDGGAARPVEGRGVEAAEDHALAEKGDDQAQHSLGLAYADGEGVPQSDEHAIELYKLSSAQGHVSATTNLGTAYGHGQGVDMSYAEGRRLFELAVARGDSEVAPTNLQILNDYIQRNIPLLGQRVVLRGLNTAALNGTRGTAVDFGCSERHPETGGWFADSARYTVRLDGPEGRLVKVRTANVEEEEDDWTGGAGPGVGGGKKKGAGKKGRARGRK